MGFPSGANKNPKATRHWKSIVVPDWLVLLLVSIPAQVVIVRVMRARRDRKRSGFPLDAAATVRSADGAVSEVKTEAAMTNQAVPPTGAPSRRRVAALYIVPLLVMVAAWTLIRYVDQPYRSPTYRRTLMQCVGHAAWVTPVEGAGPLVLLSLYAAHVLLPRVEM